VSSPRHDLATLILVAESARLQALPQCRNRPGIESPGKSPVGCDLANPRLHARAEIIHADLRLLQLVDGNVDQGVVYIRGPVKRIPLTQFGDRQCSWLALGASGDRRVGDDRARGHCGVVTRGCEYADRCQGGEA
jgi:hypothetical protein